MCIRSTSTCSCSCVCFKPGLPSPGISKEILVFAFEYAKNCFISITLPVLQVDYGFVHFCPSTRSSFVSCCAAPTRLPGVREYTGAGGSKLTQRCCSLIAGVQASYNSKLVFFVFWSVFAIGTGSWTRSLSLCLTWGPPLESSEVISSFRS